MKHYTTIEQSKKLLELGLKLETADMIYRKEFDPYYNTYVLNEEYPEFLKFSGDFLQGDVPCWSLGALLEIMPEQIIYSDFKPFPLGLFKGNKEEHSKYGHYWIQYFATDSGGAYVQTNGHSLIEAAFNMVVWLLENGYINS